MIELTSGQQDGKTKAKHWYKNQTKQVFEIAGYAGTGKTTLVYSIIDDLDISFEDVAFVTYTGKAALVLTLKGCKAGTIHRLIYESQTIPTPILDTEGNEILDENGEVYLTNKLSFVKKKELPENIKLIVCDECSMIDKKMLDDLKSFGIPILVLGDLCQLRPIYGKSVLLKNPDVSLTEIMRQKKGDPIIHLATLAREGKYIDLGKFGRSYVIDRSDFDSDFFNNQCKMDKIITSADIVLCRTNKTRKLINTHIRENIFGITKEIPTMNDKVICRKNNWETCIEEELELNLVNGLIGHVQSPITQEDINKKSYSFNIDFKPEMCDSDFFENIPCSMIPFIKISEDEAKVAEYKQYKSFEKKGIKCNKFEYGYAITDYLSQGSQWDKLVIYDEFYGSKQDYYNSLYVMITRAVKQVIIGKKVSHNVFYR